MEMFNEIRCPSFFTCITVFKFTVLLYSHTLRVMAPPMHAHMPTLCKRKRSTRRLRRSSPCSLCHDIFPISSSPHSSSLPYLAITYLTSLLPIPSSPHAHPSCLLTAPESPPYLTHLTPPSLSLPHHLPSRYGRKSQI